MLVPVAPELWTAEHLLALPGGVRLPGRMTVARLPGSRLLVYSPIPLTDALGTTIDVIGKVTWLVAPSVQHHRFVAPWLARYPAAALHGAEGLARKRPDLPWRALDPAALPFAEAVAAQLVAGAPRLNEVVLVHRPSRSLLVADLLFNVTRPANRATHALLWLTGTHEGLAMSRAWRLYTRDRRALGASLERVLSWDFTRILPCHGAVLAAADAPAVARVALASALR
jgi:hypothetical protein